MYIPPIFYIKYLFFMSLAYSFYGIGLALYYILDKLEFKLFDKIVEFLYRIYSECMVLSLKFNDKVGGDLWETPDGEYK